MATSTAQLPILTPRQPALSQRPSLRLDTQQLRTFGKGSSLRLDTLSAVSPTARNTFSNAYAPPASAAPATGRPSKLRLSIDSSCNAPTSASTPSSASTLSSALTSASTDSAAIIIPYKQPHNVRSILSNGPTPRKMASARPLFPAEKRVSFRAPLEEEIKTVKYTLAHSDIESSVSTISSLATTSSEESETATPLSINTKPTSTASPTLSIPSSSSSSSSSFASLQTSPRPGGPRAGDKRDSSDSDSDSCPETPVAGRRKRRRDWRWTLGPLPSDASTSPSASTSEATSEDSA
ncbi:hypothetical protein P171DRAFT_483330 [Karstenula rhodostoma CBS 690.94]|uniref:Uncharacterized protein n=1 Tax=Karstenula rhodostoma CBS 690.94 TaxID=1392251 RepID=A0A9P4PQR6_9PLEO|nr:hypothetical protein P171DRAFT_483330 [Karstenula rhodostoma CBS 690.94]